MNKKYLWPIGGLIILLVVAVSLTILNATKTKNLYVNDKIYVAAEDDGRIDVINPGSRSVVAKIDLASTNNSSESMYMAHNVQVAPDGKSVWVTANAMADKATEHKTSMWNKLFPTAYADSGHGDIASSSDQVIVIDPETDKITNRIDMGSNLHLAHVVLTPDSRYAVVAAQEEGAIYKIDTNSYKVVETIKTESGAEPHGLRITPDGKYAFIAMVEGKSLGKLDLQTSAIKYIPLNGKPVQTAITPDGKYVATSVFDSKSVAVHSTDTQGISYVNLPTDAKGPIQLYPTPDSAFIYVADQGNYFGQPNSDKVYKVSIKGGKVTQEISAGTAPHGVVVSPDGKITYVTNLVSNDVSVIDNAAGKEIARIPVGQKPNGISYWVKQ